MQQFNTTYALEFDEQALKDIKQLKKSEKQAYNKLLKLLAELIEHPITGTGKPEMLKFGLSGLYSRRITQKHRLVYKVNNEKMIILIISTIGHYSEK